MDDTAGAFAEFFEVNGASDGPLAGKTLAIKDLYDIAGRVTGCGNPDWQRTHGAAERTAPAVQALLDAGGRIVGKTHTDELAYSLMGVNAHYGTPLNTAAPDRVPGGSSSGSVSAVAAGLADIGLGSDTGGSVRMPASFCGVYGIRTSQDALDISCAMPLAPSFDTVGWFARDVSDLMAAAKAYGMGGGTALTRIILPVDAWARASAETVAALAPMLARFEAALGPATPLILAPEGLVAWREAFRLHQGHEVWEVHGAWVSETDPDFGPGIRDRFEMARGISETEFEGARADRNRIRARLGAVLPTGTVMIVPTAPGPAPLKSEDQATLDDYRARALELLCPAGHAGLPQISVPAGVVDGGPVGLSLVSAAGTDADLLATVATVLTA